MINAKCFYPVFFLVLLLPLNGLAEFVAPDFRGQPFSTYQQWRVFTSATEPNFPDFANQNTNGTATLLETTGGAFVTSGGNIYSFAVATQFVVVIPDYGLGPQATTRVVVQIRTQGGTVDLSSVTFNGFVAESAELLYEEPLGGFGGILRDWKFVWTELSGNESVNVLEFSAAGSSMSLDRLAVDTLASVGAAPSLLGSFVLHTGFSGGGDAPWNGLNPNAVVIKRGPAPAEIELDNLINSSRGINGLILDFDKLNELSDVGLEFQWSPQGVFDSATHPVSSWEDAPAPSHVDLFPGQGTAESARVRIHWPDFSIMNRYLKIKVKAGENQLAELYVGHLLGETNGPTGNTFSVSFADITPIRSAVGQTAEAGSMLDINKDGLITFADISAMRVNVGAQLTRITIPAQ